MKKGTIIYHENFKFKNGEIGEKLLVLLNTPKPSSEPYLFCKTTSQKDTKPQIPGCHPLLSLFFIPARQDFFIKDTWLQLYDIYPFTAASVLRDSFTRQLIVKGNLNKETIKNLMNCISLVKDIESAYKKLILGEDELLEKLFKSDKFKIKKGRES